MKMCFSPIFFSLFILVVHSQQFTIVRQIPNVTYSSQVNQFLLEINQMVNRPVFSALIRFFSNSSNSSITTIDVSLNTSNVTYVNHTLTFALLSSVQSNLTNDFCIFFDGGVLFSNNSINSSAQNSCQFWHLTMATSVDTSTSMTMTYPSSTMMMSSDTSQSVFMSTHTSLMTSMPVTSSVFIQTTQTHMTSTSANPVIQGESSPTRSAQWGMGLGITFISIIVIVEIVYFKFCHSSLDRSGSYYT